jgi:hypothetical protein
MLSQYLSHPQFESTRPQRYIYICLCVCVITKPIWPNTLSAHICRRTGAKTNAIQTRVECEDHRGSSQCWACGLLTIDLTNGRPDFEVSSFQVSFMDRAILGRLQTNTVSPVPVISPETMLWGSRFSLRYSGMLWFVDLWVYAEFSK